MNTSFLSFLHQIEIIKWAQPHQIEIIGVARIRQSIVKNQYVPAKPVIYTWPSDRQIAPVQIAYISCRYHIHIVCMPGICQLWRILRRSAEHDQRRVVRRYATNAITVRERLYNHLTELSRLFRSVLNCLIFCSFVHLFTFYAVHCVFLRTANIDKILHKKGL